MILGSKIPVKCYQEKSILIFVQYSSWQGNYLVQAILFRLGLKLLKQINDFTVTFWGIKHFN